MERVWLTPNSSWQKHFYFTPYLFENCQLMGMAEAATAITSGTYSELLRCGLVNYLKHKNYKVLVINIHQEHIGSAETFFGKENVMFCEKFTSSNGSRMCYMNINILAFIDQNKKLLE